MCLLYVSLSLLKQLNKSVVIVSERLFFPFLSQLITIFKTATIFFFFFFLLSTRIENLENVQINKQTNIQKNHRFLCLYFCLKLLLFFLLLKMKQMRRYYAYDYRYATVLSQFILRLNHFLFS